MFLWDTSKKIKDDSQLVTDTIIKGWATCPNSNNLKIWVLTWLMWCTYPLFYLFSLPCVDWPPKNVLKHCTVYVLEISILDAYKSIFMLQAICHPLSNLMSTHRRSIQKSHMLAMAWFLAIVLSIPQLFVFHGKRPLTCRAEFMEPWGKKVHHFPLFQKFLQLLSKSTAFWESL